MGLSNDSRSASNLGAFLQAALVAVALLPLTFVGGCKSNGGLIRGNDAKKTNLCPNCAYDLTPLNKADEPAKFCPRCGKPIDSSAAGNTSVSSYSEPSANAGEEIAAELNANAESRKIIDESSYAFVQESPKEAETISSADPTQGSLVPTNPETIQPGGGAQFADDPAQSALAQEKTIEQAAKEQADAARQAANQAQQALAAQADAAQNAVNDAAAALQEKTEAAADAAKETAKEAAEAVEETANAVAETAEQAAENVKEAVESGAEAAQNAAESVKQAGEDAAKEIEHSVNKAESENVPAGEESDPNDDTNWGEGMVKNESKPVLQNAAASSNAKQAQMKTVTFKKSAVPAKTASGKTAAASKNSNAAKGASSKSAGTSGSQKKSGKKNAAKK